MGPALVIVVLTMPKKNVENRLEKRHAKKEEKETVGWLMVIKFLRNYVYFSVLKRRMIATMLGVIWTLN